VAWPPSWQRRRRGADPDQHHPILVERQSFRLHDLGLQILQIVVIESKPTLQRPVGHPSFALEEVEDLPQDFIKRHVQSSTTRISRLHWR
jgi:hypothetical protein